MKFYVFAMDYSRIYKYKHEENAPEEEQKPEFTDPESSEDDDTKPRRFKYLMYVFLFSLLMILYVANVIKVKSLLKEERKLSKHLEKIENENQLLKTEINRLESPERITSVATKKLGMVKPDTPPKVIAAK